jgi:hypothetical protein
MIAFNAATLSAFPVRVSDSSAVRQTFMNFSASLARPILASSSILATAVRRESNQAVSYWWGVSGQTVTKWRKALSVATTNEGPRRLRSEYALEEPIADGRKLAWTKARDPIRRAKIAASKLGKKRPRHVVEAHRQANLCHNPSSSLTP